MLEFVLCERIKANTSKHTILINNLSAVQYNTVILLCMVYVTVKI